MDSVPFNYSVTGPSATGDLYSMLNDAMRKLLVLYIALSTDLPQNVSMQQEDSVPLGYLDLS